MNIRPTILLALAALAVAGPPEIKPLVEEFERSRTDDARRMAIIRRLGELKHSAASRALFELARKHRFRPLACVLELAPAADPQTVRDLVQYVKLQRAGALHDGLGLALPTVVDAEAGPWLIEKGLVARSAGIRLACVRTLGAWGTPEAIAPLLKLARAQIDRAPDRRDAALLYECVLALRRIGGDPVQDLLARCETDRDWRVRLAVAGDALVLDPHPVVRWASIERATKAVAGDLAALHARGSSRTRALAATALERVAGRRYADWVKWCETEGLEPRTAAGAIEPIPVRVLVVADMSARAGTPAVDGVGREVAEIVRKLPDDAVVDVVTVANAARVVRVSTKPLGTPAGKLNLQAGLRAAFRDAPHVVHLACARMPDDIAEPAELLAELHRLNRLPRAVVHTVAVHHGKRSEPLESLLRALARQGRGTFRAIRQPSVTLR